MSCPNIYLLRFHFDEEFSLALGPLSTVQRQHIVAAKQCRRHKLMSAKESASNEPREATCRRATYAIHPLRRYLRAVKTLAIHVAGVGRIASPYVSKLEWKLYELAIHG